MFFYAKFTGWDAKMWWQFHQNNNEIFVSMYVRGFSVKYTVNMTARLNPIEAPSAGQTARIITRTPVFWEYPRCPMITHTIDLYQITSQNKQSKIYKFEKFAKSSNFGIWQIHCTWHTWSCLIGCVNMKWIQLVLWKLQSGRDSVHRQMDRQRDGQMDGRT